MPTDTKTSNLVINTLTKAQYESIDKSDTEFYMVTDEIPLSAGDNISLLNNDSGFITEKELSDGLGTKQDTITDLAEIREGAEKGATAVQPSALTGYATKQELAAKQDKGNYALRSEIPTQTSQLTNNSDFTTKAYVDGLVGDIETALHNINSGA